MRQCSAHRNVNSLRCRRGCNRTTRKRKWHICGRCQGVGEQSDVGLESSQWERMDASNIKASANAVPRTCRANLDKVVGRGSGYSQTQRQVGAAMTTAQLIGVLGGMVGLVGGG